MDYCEYIAETELTPSEYEKAEDKHTKRTIEAIGILKGAFDQIEEMQMIINDRDLQIQELNRENLKLKMKLYTAS